MALLEARSYRPFKSSEEYLYAMREDLAEWLNVLYPELLINTDNFMERLDTGVALCKHAHHVRHSAEEYLARRQARNKSMTKSFTSGAAGPILAMGNIHFLPGAKSGTFFARDNVSNFIAWCRKSLQIFECLLFETDDLIMRKNEKHVILCLLEVARRGAKFGMLAPMLVQMERQIDREIAADNRAAGVSCDTQTESSGDDTANGKGNAADASTGTELEAMFESDTDEEEDEEEPMLMYGPQPQIVTNDLKSLDEMVRDLVEKCTCPSQFPMVRVSEGKYRIGDTKVLIFVRILRSHVMVRVGGGWDTLSHYLDKHDPCRCRAQHRSSVAARLITRTNHAANGGAGGIELHKAQVLYERSPTALRKSTDNNGTHRNGGQYATQVSPHHQLPTLSSAMLTPPQMATRSRSPTPQRRVGFVSADGDQQKATNNKDHIESPLSSLDRRSVSPAVHRRNGAGSAADLKAYKQSSLDSNTSTTTSASTTTNNNVGSGGNINVSTTSSSGGSLSFDAGVTGGSIIDISSATLAGGGDGKFENISDNGSEISDEGYRSLGLIQGGVGTANANINNNNNNRMSLISQTSTDDAELNVRLETITSSSDSQTSVTDELGLAPIANDTADASTPLATPHTSPEPTSSAASSNATTTTATAGIFVTDDHIAIVADAPARRSTALPKPASSRHQHDEVPIKPLIDGTTPAAAGRRFSPLLTRRKSIDGSAPTVGTGASGHSGQTVGNAGASSGLSRRIPAYRSMRAKSQQTATTAAAPAAVAQKDTKPTGSSQSHQNSTWSAGRTAIKKRITIGPDTFRPAASVDNTTAAAFQRNSAVRSSHSGSLYDRNGRRIGAGTAKSTSTSPTKALSPTPLVQQIQDAARTAKNDAQMLQKMKQLLNQYTNKPPAAAGDVAAAQAAAADCDDFTTAWVNSNGGSSSPLLNDRQRRVRRCSTGSAASSCGSASPVKAATLSKRSSAASSMDSAASGSGPMSLPSMGLAPRPQRGSSRIPAPIRQNTLMY